VLGALPHIIRFARDPIGAAGRLFARYGDLVAIVRAPSRIVSPRGRCIILANGPELNREILTQHERYWTTSLSGPFYPEDADLARAETSRLPGQATAARLKPLRRLLTGLFQVNGDEHKRHRRLLQPAFHKMRIDAYRDAMAELTTEMLSTWKVGEVRNVLADMTRLTLRIATKTLFGEDVGERGVELAQLMQDWLLTVISPAMLIPLDIKPLPYQRFLDLSRDIDQRTAAILHEKHARIAAAPKEDVARDILSMLIAARDEDGSALTEDEIVGHAGVIFAAGHETSTNALAWTLFLLAMHPDVACDLTDELSSVLRGDVPTVEQLGKLPLLDAVIKESMRVLPPVPLHPRVVAEDTELGGHSLPARTELFVSIYHIHHDQAIFDDPHRFRPERWSRIKPSPFEYNPFSAGPRMCIGAAFAMMEIKIALATLLQRFRVELLPGMTIDHRVAITMAPRAGLPMRVRPADGGYRSGPRDVRGTVRDLLSLSS
jgi:cytochrome P450